MSVTTDESNADNDTTHLSDTYSSQDTDTDTDDDIDVEYDWTAKSYKTKPTNTTKSAENDSDSDSDTSNKSEQSNNDSDIDVSYDWTSNTNNDNTALNIDVNLDNKRDSVFDLDSPKFLDTPLYSNTPHITDITSTQSFDINNIANLNLATNEYNEEEISQSGQQSPISMLTPAQSFENNAHVRFPSFLPSKAAKLMNVIMESEKENDIKENERENIVQCIDECLGKYYKRFEMEYFDAFGKGKFERFCTESELTNEEIYNYLHSELTDSGFLYFDTKFPFNVSNTISDESIDEKTMEQLREIEVYTVIKYCFQHKEPPK